MAEQLCFSNILCATDGQLTSSDPNRLNKRHHFHCHLSGHETTANAAEAGCVEGDGCTGLVYAAASEGGHGGPVAVPANDEFFAMRVNTLGDSMYSTHVILVLTVYAISMEEKTALGHSQDVRDDQVQDGNEDDVGILILIPHRHATSRLVRVQSSCMQRVSRNKLDAAWSIDPCWCDKPLVFESPIEARFGRGNLEVTVDSKAVAGLKFEQNGERVLWSVRGEEGVEYFGKNVKLVTRLELEADKDDPGDHHDEDILEPETYNLGPFDMMFHPSDMQGVVHTTFCTLAWTFEKSPEEGIVNMYSDVMGKIGGLIARKRQELGECFSPFGTDLLAHEDKLKMLECFRILLTAPAKRQAY